MSHFVWTTQAHVSRTAAAKINKAIKHIDPEAEFVRHYATGQTTTISAVAKPAG